MREKLSYHVYKKTFLSINENYRKRLNNGKKMLKIDIWDKYFTEKKFRIKINRRADELKINDPLALKQISLMQKTIKKIKPPMFKVAILKYSEEK